MRKDPLAKLKKHKREQYMYDQDYKLYGSMFFWFYSVLCFSDFNSSLFAGSIATSKRLRKKIDTKVLLALELMRFTTAYNDLIDWELKSPISYRNLMIIWGLVFDRQSVWNKELRDILKGTGKESILDLPTPPSYDKFFSDIDSNGIDKINFKKFLQYLPKEMFIDAVDLILKCQKEERTKPDDLWDNEILGCKWGKCYYRLYYAAGLYIKKPSKKELRNNGNSFWSPEEWLASFRRESSNKNLVKKLGLSTKLYGYTRQYTTLSSEKWIATMEPILEGIAERKKQEEEQIEREGFQIGINGEKTIIIKPSKK